ncbi:hypothetical protein BLL40_04685 [Domibacillus mangrovi]|uniref:Uncharacterized protein n=2 Tax=Domibacillus mangrovi TaxID=1714354 RepID=A0A1Q5P5Q1_9BACI|nr:hypothetical protein BLL40_04685 [Domibacillus mangrovi]
MKTELKEISYELDDKVNSVSLSVRTLNDIQILLGQLKVSMEEADHSNDRQFYFESHFRKVRVLSELTFYTMGKLGKDLAYLEELKDKLFEMVNSSEENKKASTECESKSEIKER